MVNNVCTIYVIKNTKNSKVYVGQTWLGIEKRFSKHISDKKGECCKLFRAFNKYGRENFWIEEVINCSGTQKEADDLEIYFIKQYDSVKNGYNIRDGGSHGKFPQETKNKMSIARKGKKMPLRSEEHCKNLSLAFVGKYVGEKHSNAKFTWIEINKIRELYMLGKNCPELAKQFNTHPTNINRIVRNIAWVDNNYTPKMRSVGESLKGRKDTDEARKNKSEAKMGNTARLGHKHSIGSRQKMSASLSGEKNPSSKLTDEQRQNIFEEFINCQSVKLITLAKTYNITTTRVVQIIKKIAKTACIDVNFRGRYAK